MKKIILMTVFGFSLIYNVAHAITTLDSRVVVDFYQKFDGNYTNERKLGHAIYDHLSAVHEVEFTLNPDLVGAFRIPSMDLEETDVNNGGFILELTDGNFSKKAWYFMLPPADYAEDKPYIPTFNAFYSYRITAYRVLSTNQISSCSPITFEIEGKGPWVVDGQKDSNKEDTVRLDNPKVADINTLRACDEKMCGFDKVPQAPCHQK